MDNNKDSEYKDIAIEIPDNMKEFLNSLKYKNGCILEFVFSEKYNKQKILSTYDTSKPENSLKKLERTLKNKLPNLDERSYYLIEDLLLRKDSELRNNGITDQSNKKKLFVRKYDSKDALYESITIGDIQKFIKRTTDSFEYVDYIEDRGCTFYPLDDVISQNPAPYAFESEQEVSEFIELAKKKSFSSMFNLASKVYRKYVKSEDHSLTILSASIVYSYFQDRFGTTYYNILVGDNGSGKNSALLVYKMLGYRPFYVNSASTANYYTFLGKVQQGQGTIVEDEADNIAYLPDKKNMIKSGYSPDGSIPKVGFSDGQRFQETFYTFCHKWFAMEELLNDKYNRGIIDRSFTHHFIRGCVMFNIKEILKDVDSENYEEISHLRKLLFAFKLVNYYHKFPKLRTNLIGRNAELTDPLLRMFYGGESFEPIRSALSKAIHDKTLNKNNSDEAKITQTLKKIRHAQGEHYEKEYMEVYNNTFFDIFKEICDARDYTPDITWSTFFFPDGTKISKSKIFKLLTSKFKVKPMRTSQARGFRINLKDLEQMEKQYEVIDKIIVFDDNEIEKENDDLKKDNEVTEVTQMTDFKHDPPSLFSNSSTTQPNDKNEGEIDRSDQHKTDIRNDGDDVKSSDIKQRDEPHSGNDDNILENRIKDDYEKESKGSDQNLQTEKVENKEILPTTPSNSVTSVTSVTALPPQYPCYFCGNDYMTHIDFDMGNHYVEKHNDLLNYLPITGNRETRITWAIAETKRRLFENSSFDGEENES